MEDPRTGASKGKRPDRETTREPVATIAARRLMLVSGTARALGQRAWDASYMQESRRRIRDWYHQPYAGTLALLVGTAFFTLFVLAIDRAAVPLPNPGIVYLPFIAMLAYHWSWRHGVLASLLQLSIVYYIFVPLPWTIKLLTAQQLEELITLAAVDGFILILVQLARKSRDSTQEEAKRFAALNTVGGALAGELDERRLLRMIAQTARDLTGAGFAAFTLRPLDPLGQPVVPSEGNFFHLAAVVGVTPEQEALFRRMPLGGEGLLAPIFRYGKPVRVGDALAMVARDYERATQQPDLAKQDARNMAFEYAHGQAGVDDLHAMGVPRGHPVVRSFLGVPLLDHNGTVRGGLLLGKSEPNHFTSEDESLLTGLAAQAAIALENARLYHSAQTQAQELDTIFESIADGVVLVDERGTVLRENRTAAQLRSQLLQRADGESLLQTLIRHPAELAMSADGEISMSAHLHVGSDGARDFVVSASMLELVAQNRATTPSLPLGIRSITTAPGAVVVWHDATETRRLIEERHAREEEEVRRRLLQLVLDELPSGIYLVRGPDARLVMANRAAQGLWGAEWPIGQEMERFLAESGAEIYGPDGRLLSGDRLATVQVARTGADVRHHLEVIRRPDTSTLPVLLNAVALDPALLGDPEGSGDTSKHSALVVLQDVTALKEAERVKDEFITLAAHELKTPMAAVKGYAEMLARRSDMDGEHALSDWQIEALEAIDQSTTRLVELTEDLLDVTRIQAGRLDLHTEPHDVYALVRRVTRRMQVTTHEHLIRIHASSEFIVASLDVRRMEQVLSNLLSNAIKYSPDGGEIDVSVFEDKAHSHAIISVRDHGIGVPADQQSHLFRRFSRADNARMLGISGTGLGLYLCREIVERQGGNIWFESEEGKGSSFCVSLPLVKEAEPAAPEGVTAG